MFSFKDKNNINHKTAEIDNLELIADFCKEAFHSPNPDHVLKMHLRDVWEDDKTPHPDHSGCTGFLTPEEKKKDKKTEKQICRCMRYFSDSSDTCNRCLVEHKWKNIGEIAVTEYEMPTKYVMKGAGGMDLILDNQYAVEVKPPGGNEETLSRMFSEILTYTVDTDYKPGIAMFKGSPQWKRFTELIGAKNAALREVMKYVKVFYIDYELKDRVAEYKIEVYDGDNA